MPVNRISRFGMDGDPHLGLPPMTDPAFVEEATAPARPQGVPLQSQPSLPPRKGLSPLLTVGLLGLAGLGAWWYLKNRKKKRLEDDEVEEEEEEVEEEEPDEDEESDEDEE